MRSINLKEFFVVSGPCVIENETHAMYSAEFLTTLFEKKGVQFIFKSSYDKANRCSIHSFRGPGIEEGLKILEKIRETFSIPVFTDVHSPEEAREAGEVCDVIQIPAFLCRQTDLLLAAGNTRAIVNIKKGQFLAPWDIKYAIEKVISTGNNKIILTDRGTSFGYNNLVSDMRAIPIMQKFGYPVMYDATHSIQLPGSHGTHSGAQREFVEPLSKAAIAAGCHGIYAESHQDPKLAKSDSDSMIPFKELPELVDSWQRIYEATSLCTKNS